MAVILIRTPNRSEKKKSKSRNNSFALQELGFQQDSLSPDAARLLLAELRQEQTRLELKNDELLRIQAELEESRSRYYDFYHIAPVGFLTLTPAGIAVEVNRTLGNMMQREAYSYSDLEFSSFVHPDERELFKQQMAFLFETGISQSFMTRIRKKNGFFWARIEAVLTRDNNIGPVARVVIVDITERKNAEAALQTQVLTEKALRIIAEAALSSHSVIELCEKVREVLRSLTAAENFLIALLDAKKQEIHYVFRDITDASFPARRPVGKGLTEYIMRAGKAMFLSAEDLKKLKEQGEDSVPYTKVNSWLGAPLIDADENVFGSIAIFSCQETNLTEAVSLEVFSVIAAQIAQAISIKQIQDAVQNSEIRLNTVLGSIPDIIWIKNLSGQYQYCNPMFEKVFGKTKQVIMGKTDEELFGGKLLSEKTESDLSELKIGSTISTEDCILSELNESEIWLETIKTPMIDLQGNMTGILGVSRNISERKKLQEELKILAQTDELTGLPNRRHFLAAAERALRHVRRYGGACSLLLLDLDSFKRINDVFGHAVGDIVLREVSRHFLSALRASDLIGRIGGEEFAILLSETDLAGAEFVAERLRINVEAAELFSSSGIPLPLTVSIGLAEFHGKTDTLAELMVRADAALYSAKKAGKNTVFREEKTKFDADS